MKDNRPSWNEYFMNIAKETAMRGTCMSARIGAVVVRDKTIISTGYIGAPRKTRDCYDRGFCLRRKLNIPSGHRYELCRSVHAEMNAIVNAARSGVNPVGAEMYLWGMRIHDDNESLINAFPCFMCKKMIINAGIATVHSMTEEGKIRTFDVEKEWVNSWQNYDMLDDMDIYSTEYEALKEKQ
jgi:dCMP deaminase